MAGFLNAISPTVRWSGAQKSIQQQVAGSKTVQDAFKKSPAYHSLTMLHKETVQSEKIGDKIVHAVSSRGEHLQSGLLATTSLIASLARVILSTVARVFNLNETAHWQAAVTQVVTEGAALGISILGIINPALAKSLVTAVDNGLTSAVPIAETVGSLTG